MAKRAMEKDWLSKISEYRSSGKTQKEWCKEQNMSFSRFKYWLKKEKSMTIPDVPDVKWLPVEIKQEIQVRQSLHIKIGIATVKVNPGFDREFLLDILKTLQSL
jgi:hypothetical protein